MKKFIFDLITSPFSLFDNPFYNYLAMALIGVIAYKVAFNVVKELGLRGEAGSIAHWTIRFIVFTLIWLLCCIVIKCILFMVNNWILVLICALSLLSLYFAKKYAGKHPKSILNKKIF